MPSVRHISSALSGLILLSASSLGASAVDCEQIEPSFKNCAQACMQLAEKLPSKVIFSNNFNAYSSEQSGFWSLQQSQADPDCFVTPEAAEDVSHALLIAKSTKCPLAVKGGGHTSFTGASSIQGGISIDLRKMNQVTPNHNLTIVSVGPGSRWKAVYDVTEPLNITVIGGRVAEVGVAGLTLGGGLSFFTGLHGFACDNVANYEVVLADGSIKNVSEHSLPDLYWALRGGSNNFGIVTRFDLDAYPVGPVSGGNLNFNQSQAKPVTEAYFNFAYAINEVPQATTWLAFSYIPAYKQHVLNMIPFYANGTDPAAADAFYSNFTSLPTLSDDITVTQQSTLTIANAQPSGYRNTWWAFTFRPDLELMQDIVDRYLAWDLSQYGGISSMVYTAVSKPALARMSRRGGNPLGLTEEDGPLIIVSITPQWNETSQDAQVYAATEEFVNESVKRAEAKGVASKYIYLNYADNKQDVFAGYGEANLRRLRNVSMEYDPEGVFQKLVPGGIKLF